MKSKSLISLLIVIGFMTGIVHTAGAVAIYTYTGNPFTVVTGPYTTDNFITATLTLDNPLAVNLSSVDVTGFAGFSLTMSDGQQMLTDATSGLTIISATVSTDTNGNIVADWAVRLDASPMDPSIATINLTPPIDNIFDRGELDGDIGQVEMDPGTWSCSGMCLDSTDPIPEPSSVFLFSSGLAGIVWWRYRKSAVR